MMNECEARTRVRTRYRASLSFLTFLSFTCIIEDREDREDRRTLYAHAREARSRNVRPYARGADMEQEGM
jgi:hypothetical protein